MDKKAIADIHKNTAEVVRMGAVCDAGPTRSTRATAARSRWASRYDWRRCSPMRWCPSRSEGQCGGADRHVLQPHEPIEEGTVQSRIAAITRHCPRRYSVTTIDGVRMELDDGILALSRAPILLASVGSLGICQVFQRVALVTL